MWRVRTQCNVEREHNILVCICGLVYMCAHTWALCAHIHACIPVAILVGVKRKLTPTTPHCVPPSSSSCSVRLGAPPVLLGQDCFYLFVLSVCSIYMAAFRVLVFGYVRVAFGNRPVLYFCRVRPSCIRQSAIRALTGARQDFAE